MGQENTPPPQDVSDGREDGRDREGTQQPNQWGSEQAKRDYAARGRARAGNPEGVPDEDD